MPKREFNIGFLIYTHNRVDDAKINMEIIRNYWENKEFFEKITIVHAYNGKQQWYKSKYLENDLIRRKNPGHYQGAAELIDAGMGRLGSKYKSVDYVVVVASDTWLVRPEYIFDVIGRMNREQKHWATCPWGLPQYNELKETGAAVDFFIVDLRWARKYKMFPIDYGEFNEKYGELLLYSHGGNVMLEKLIFARYLQAVYRQIQDSNTLMFNGRKKLFRIKDREPVHTHKDKEGFWIRTPYWEKIGLITHHDPGPKKRLLKKYKITNGKNIKTLLESENLDYFNKGLKGQYKLQ